MKKQSQSKDKTPPLHELIDAVISTQTVHEYMQAIEHTLQELYTTKAEPLQKIKKNLPHTLYQRLTHYQEKNGLDREDITATQNLLRDLQKFLQELPTLQLTLAIQPSQAVVEEIAEWLTIHAPTPLLLNIVVNPTLIGGATVGFKGKLYDFSLNTRIDTYLKTTVNHHA